MNDALEEEKKVLLERMHESRASYRYVLTHEDEHRHAGPKEKLMAKIASTRDAAKGIVDDAREQIHHGKEYSKEYVKGHPMQSVGYAALAGLLLGLLTTRR